MSGLSASSQARRARALFSSDIKPFLLSHTLPTGTPCTHCSESCEVCATSECRSLGEQEQIAGLEHRRIPQPFPLPRYLRLVRHLKEADFVPLYILYHVARILRCIAARTSSGFLAGLHSLLALPKGNADQLATLTVTEGDESFEPVLLLQYGQ